MKDSVSPADAADNSVEKLLQGIRADTEKLRRAIITPLDTDSPPGTAEYAAAVKLWRAGVYDVWHRTPNDDDRGGISWRYKRMTTGGLEVGYGLEADLIGLIPQHLSPVGFAAIEVHASHAADVWRLIWTRGLALVAWLNSRVAEFEAATYPTIELIGDGKTGHRVRITLAGHTTTATVTAGQWQFLESLLEDGEAKFYRAGSAYKPDGKNDGKWKWLVGLLPELAGVIHREKMVDENFSIFSIEKSAQTRMKRAKR